MNKSVLFILLLLFLMGDTACSQNGKAKVIDLSTTQNITLEYKKDLKPFFKKIISENKHCSFDVYKDELYLTTISDKHTEEGYRNSLFLRKTDLEGNEKWVFVIDEFLQTSLKDILATDDGVYILYEGYTGRLARDCYLKKLDTDGEELWTINYGKNYGTDILDIMKLDANGNLLFVLNKNERSTLHRISPTGEMINKKTFSAKTELKISDFEFDKNGNIFVIGQITSYPRKEYTLEVFFYKLDNQFNILQKKVKSFGKVSIANDLVLLESGKFAVKISSDIDSNRKIIEEHIVPLFFLMDINLNFSNITQLSSTKSGNRSTFKSISADKIIAVDQTYLNKTSYYLFHTFDGEMNYQKTTLVNFKTGVMDVHILPEGQLIICKFGEEIHKMEIEFD